MKDRRELKWVLKRPYGNELYYPACELSALVCACCQVKSVKSATLDRVRQAGFVVEVQGDQDKANHTNPGVTDD